MKIKKIKGCVPDREDKRDFIFKPKLLARFSIFPTKIDWSEYFPPIKNQGDEGSCVGFSTTASREFWEIYKKQNISIDLSERFIYEEAKKRDEWVGENYDGTSIRGAMKSLKAVGICEEKYWQYIPLKKGNPLNGYLENAALYKIIEYQKIPLKYIYLREALKRGPVTIGINVPETMFFVSEQGIVEKTESYDCGGHAMVLVGYNDSEKLFKVRNSWGTDWGDKGYCYFSYEFLEKIIFSAWQITEIKINEKNE